MIQTLSEKESKEMIENTEIDVLLYDTERIQMINEDFSKWEYTKILNDIVQNDIEQILPIWFTKYILPLSYIESYELKKRMKKIRFFLQMKNEMIPFQFVNKIYNEEGKIYILFIVKYNDTTVLFMLYTIIDRKLENEIRKDRMIDLPKKNWKCYIADNKLKWKNMFLMKMEDDE
jgi:hypothetical protein